MATKLLNENQFLHFTTYWRLLADDLDFLARLDEMKRSGREYERVRRALVQVRSAVEGIREQLSLPADRAPSLERRVAAVAAVWAVRVEELRPRQLKHGRDHSRLPRRRHRGYRPGQPALIGAPLCRIASRVNAR